MAPNIILLGPAGAGKSTQVDQLVTHQNYHPISLGQFLRSEQFLRSPMGVRVTRLLNTGLLIDDFTANTTLFSIIQQSPKDKPFVIEGFPRNAQQAEKLKKFTADNNISIDLILELNVSSELASNRIHDQAAREKSSEDDQFNDQINTQSNKIAIHNDTDEAIHNRLQSYNDEINSVREALNNWATYVVVDANKPREEITASLFDQLQQFNRKAEKSAADKTTFKTKFPCL
jgi:adenylate kinase